MIELIFHNNSILKNFSQSTNKTTNIYKLIAMIANLNIMIFKKIDKQNLIQYAKLTQFFWNIVYVNFKNFKDENKKIVKNYKKRLKFESKKNANNNKSFSTRKKQLNKIIDVDIKKKRFCKNIKICEICIKYE